MMNQHILKHYIGKGNEGPYCPNPRKCACFWVLEEKAWDVAEMTYQTLVNRTGCTEVYEWMREGAICTWCDKAVQPETASHLGSNDNPNEDKITGGDHAGLDHIE